MMAVNEWSAWEESWRSVRTAPGELDDLVARTNRARRSIVIVRLVSTGVAVLSLGVVGAALRHAANSFEAALGLLVGLGIAAVWLIDALDRRDSAGTLVAPPEAYLATRRRLCIRRLRFARLGWIVAALDLVFLVPWWIGGTRVHGTAFTGWQLLTVWAPLAAIVGFVAWTFVLRARAAAELRRLPVPEPSTSP